MKTNHESDNDEPLRQALSQWTVSTPLPPRFQEQVWRRIALAEALLKGPFQAGLGRLLEAVVARPRFALAYVAATLALGIIAGSVAAQVRTSRLENSLSARYVQSINPYQALASHP
jgi:hypothetical protein